MPRKTTYSTGRRPVWPEVPVCTVAYVPAMVSARPLLVHLCSFALMKHDLTEGSLPSIIDGYNPRGLSHHLHCLQEQAREGE